MGAETKTCPACGETIQAAAMLCRFCKSDFRKGAPAAAPPRRSGFPIWLIVVLVAGILCVPGVAIIAAIAIPGLLAAQRAANESNASASLKTLLTAEINFRSNDRDSNEVNDYWVGDVSGLHRHGQLIESALAAADATEGSGQPKAGYLYAAIKLNAAGKPYDRGEGRNPDGFAFCAYPESYGSAGRRTFIVNEEYTIWSKDTGGSRETRWPKDPAADGWHPLR